MPDETKFHGAASRPDAAARACGLRYRSRYHRALCDHLPEALSGWEVHNAKRAFVISRKAQNKDPGAAMWGSLQVRREVLLAVTILQSRHLANTGKEIGRPEVVNAVFLAGLQALTQQAEAFAR